MLSRDAFLAVTVSFPREEIVVPDLGGSVFVRVMSAAERDQFGADSVDGPDSQATARLVQRAACDADGNPLFTPADVPRLSELPATWLDPIAQAAARVNRLTKEATEDVQKN